MELDTTFDAIFWFPKRKVLADLKDEPYNRHHFFRSSKALPITSLFITISKLSISCTLVTIYYKVVPHVSINMYKNKAKS